jgi:hypothetical protein
MEEVDEVPIVASPTTELSAPTPTKTAAIVTPPAAVPVEEFEAEAEFSLFQKGLFFAVIVGCVVVYMRMSSKNKARRFQEKSMA